MSSISPQRLNYLINQSLWENYDERVNWKLSVPRCDCIICPEYISWIKRGLQLYLTDLKSFRAEVQQLEFHRSSLRLAREHNQTIVEDSNH